MKSKTNRGVPFETVGNEENLCILVGGKIIGWLKHNPHARIQARTTGEWLTGPRWEIYTKDKKQLVFIPVSIKRCVNFLLEYEKGHYFKKSDFVNGG